MVTNVEAAIVGIYMLYILFKYLMFSMSIFSIKYVAIWCVYFLCFCITYRVMLTGVPGAPVKETKKRKF